MVKRQKSTSKDDFVKLFRPKSEKLWVVGYARVRRHSRLLYIGLDPETVRLHNIRLGDTIKFMLVGLLRAPRDEEEEK